MSAYNLDIEKLKKNDIYSIILFLIYQLKQDDKYSTLSELIYILDKNSLLKLCQFYGGQTITIPKLDELENIVYALMIYQYVNIEHIPIEKCWQLIGNKKINKKQIHKLYLKISEILNSYNINV